MLSEVTLCTSVMNACTLFDLELGDVGNCAINQWEISLVDRENIHNSIDMSVVNKINSQIYWKKKLDFAVSS